ncbi:MAG: nucleotidyltransferase [Peptostreptococcaceae bacterium]|nr:nucleotidyltransferase [Peptostreptococcaceae bacterium]
MCIGIIAEYNPFHSGHLYHLNQAKALRPSSPVVVVMSGHFVQRGEPALVDKWTRAKTAVACGADLVIELPHLYASQSAELFAKGAIGVLKSTGVVRDILFGSESGDVSLLKNTAGQLIEKKGELDLLIREYLQKGFSYPKARSRAMEEAGLLSTHHPNDILGIEYIRQIFLQNSDIHPHCIQRKGAGYNNFSLKGEFSSATAIRRRLFMHSKIESSGVWEILSPSLLPTPSLEILKTKKPLFHEDFFELTRYSVLRNRESLHEIFEIEEGLEHLIVKSAMKCSSFSDLCSSVKSKRYTLNRIRRVLYNILLGVKKTSMEIVKNSDDNPYIRILAFNDRGRNCLKEMKKHTKAAIINKTTAFRPSSPLEEILFHYDMLATQIYNLKGELAANLSADCITSPQYLQ